MCVVLRSEGEDGREMALPDRDCEGQERPGEHESCPNLPPCAIPSTSSSIPDYIATSNLLSTSAPLPEDSFIIDDGGIHEEASEILNSNSSLVTLDTDDPLQDEEILLNSITTDRTYENIVQFVHSGENSTSNMVHNGRRGERGNVGGWTVTPWSPCSVTCGSGIRTRSVVCPKQEGICNPNIKPSVSEYCHTRKKCSYEQRQGELLTYQFSLRHAPPECKVWLCSALTGSRNVLFSLPDILEIPQNLHTSH
jgi:hypothetical protein